MTLQINSIADLRIHLREERLRQGLGQDQIPGLGRTTVLAFENGKGDARMETVFAIMTALGAGLTLEFAQPALDHRTDDAPGQGPATASNEDDDIDLGMEP
jgi:transcriptional regulator with XRE-family HTH domain